MELYDKLTLLYPAKHFSKSVTQTVIEEDDPQAVTRSITLEHSGTEVLKINKTLFVAVRDTLAAASPIEVCDGAVAIEMPRHFIAYVELKSACNANNVLKARSQILASHIVMQAAAANCNIPLTPFIQKGIIVTQPITDETLTKARQRRQRDDDLKVNFSNARFLLNLVDGKAVDKETGIPLVYAVAGEVLRLDALF